MWCTRRCVLSSWNLNWEPFDLSLHKFDIHIGARRYIVSPPTPYRLPQSFYETTWAAQELKIISGFCVQVHAASLSPSRLWQTVWVGPQWNRSSRHSTDNKINFKTFKSAVSSLACDGIFMVYAPRIYLLSNAFHLFYRQYFHFQQCHNGMSSCDTHTYTHARAYRFRAFECLKLNIRWHHRIFASSSHSP